MKLSDLNTWLTLGANIGVLAGIIFLAIEIQQNQQSLEESNILTRLSVNTSAFDLYTAHRNLLLENSELLNIWHKGSNGEPLDELENIQFALLYRNYFWTVATVYERAAVLGNSEYTQANLKENLNVLDQSPRLAEIWESEMRSFITDYGYQFANDFEQYRRAIEN